MGEAAVSGKFNSLNIDTLNPVWSAPILRISVSFYIQIFSGKTLFGDITIFHGFSMIIHCIAHPKYIIQYRD